MKNCEIVQYIERFCANKEEIDCLNTDLAYAILAHGYLYVRPGEAADKFKLEIINVLNAGVEEGVNNYLEDIYESWPLDEWIRMAIAQFALNVARDAFDADYFEEQCALLDDYEDCDKKILDKYLKLMEKEQLLLFMDEVSYYRARYVVFSNFEIEHKVNKELHELCRNLDPTLPDMDDVLKYLRFREKHPDYMFDYLSVEDIANAFRKVITRDVGLAGHLARMIYYTNNTYTMEQYVELIGSYERTFGKDIYDPDIFCEDLAQI